MHYVLLSDGERRIRLQRRLRRARGRRRRATGRGREPGRAGGTRGRRSHPRDQRRAARHARRVLRMGPGARRPGDRADSRAPGSAIAPSAWSRICRKACLHGARVVRSRSWRARVLPGDLSGVGLAVLALRPTTPIAWLMAGLFACFLTDHGVSTRHEWPPAVPRRFVVAFAPSRCRRFRRCSTGSSRVPGSFRHRPGAARG